MPSGRPSASWRIFAPPVATIAPATTNEARGGHHAGAITAIAPRISIAAAIGFIDVDDGAQRISGSIPVATPIKVNAPAASASMAVEWRRPITLTEVARSGNSKPSPVGEKGNPSITSAPDFGMTCHRMYQ